MLLLTEQQRIDNNKKNIDKWRRNNKEKLNKYYVAYRYKNNKAKYEEKFSTYCKLYLDNHIDKIAFLNGYLEGSGYRIEQIHE